MRLTLFGRMQAAGAASATLLPRQRKSRAVLAVLAMASPRPVVRATLQGLLWSSRGLDQARASLRQAIREIQAHLAPLGPSIIYADRTSLALRGEGIRIDAVELVAADATRPDAVGLYHQGPLLADLAGIDPAFDRWIAVEQGRLRRAALCAAEAALSLCLAERRDSAAVILAAERVMGIDGAHERACRDLMWALHETGDRAGAVSAFARCESALQREAELGPSPETLALLEQIRAARDPSRATLGYTGASPSTPLAIAAKTERSGTADGTGRTGVRIGVLPFRVLDKKEDDGFSVGLAEDITNALSRFRRNYVIASPTLAAIQHAGIGERAAVMRDLRLDFVLDGTIQRTDANARVIIKLLDLRATHEAGAEIAWSRRFDITDGNLLTLQDRIAAETVAQIDPEVTMRECRRATVRPASDVNAYDLTLRAIPAIHLLDRSRFIAARGLLDTAIALDPDYAAAHVWLAYWCIFLVGQGWAADAKATMLEALAEAERGIQLDGEDARALSIAGHARAFLERNVDTALIYHRRALEFNPNLPLAWALAALALSYDGQHQAAIGHAEEAHRLSPLDPHQFFFDVCLMVPHMALGNHRTVIELCRRSASLQGSFSANYKGYLSALGHLGMLSEAAAIRDKLLSLEPDFCIDAAIARSPLRHPGDTERYVEGLRLGGLPEHPRSVRAVA